MDYVLSQILVRFSFDQHVMQQKVFSLSASLTLMLQIFTTWMANGCQYAGLKYIAVNPSQ